MVRMISIRSIILILFSLSSQIFPNTETFGKIFWMDLSIIFGDRVVIGVFDFEVFLGGFVLELG